MYRSEFNISIIVWNIQNTTKKWVNIGRSYAYCFQLLFSRQDIVHGKGSERRKSLCRKSKKEHWKSKNQNVKSLKIRTSKITSSKRTSKVDFRRSENTFDVLIWWDRRKSTFCKNTFNVLILPMASEKIRTSKIKKSNYLWRIAYVYQGLWGVRLGSIR